MFENKIANNLKKPIGFFGRYIGRMLKGNLNEYKALEKLVLFSNKNEVLEIGYGPGYGIKHLCKEYYCNFDGIDFSETMFKVASKRNRKNIAKGRIRLFNDDFEQWKTDGKKYDLIIMLNVIYFWSEIDEKIKKIYDMLVEKGQIAIFMISPKYMEKSKITQTTIFNKHEIQKVVDILKDKMFMNVDQITPFENKECFFIIGTK